MGKRRLFHLSLITSFLEDPRGMLIFLLTALPGRLLAISAHEFAHAWVANRCGDPTARVLGRMTLNPLKHLDLLGILMMLLVGFGWAKPVPVNPLHYRNYRKDDLKVSLAGVTMNLLLFLAGLIVMLAWLGLFFGRLPNLTYARLREGVPAIVRLGGEACLFTGSSLYSVADLLNNLPYLGDLLGECIGGVGATVYKMLGYFVQTNLVLFLFNLIPLPPLDGYHVVNDLLLKKSLFARPQVMQACTLAMILLSFSGVLGDALGFVMEQVFNGTGALAQIIFSAFGLV